MNVPTDISLQVVGSVAAALLVAAVVALIATPVVRSLAFKIGAVDVPRDSRRMHDHPIPRMGGLAIFFGFILSVLLFLPLTTQLRGMLLGAVVIVILGIFDDIYALSAKLKFAVQIGAALIAVLMGNQIDYLSNPNIFSSDPYWHQGLFKSYAIISFAVPFLVLGLPIFDTCFAILRRLARGQSPMAPDRGHIHHRLIDMGFTQKQAVAVLYLISAILGLSAVVLTTNNAMKAMLFLLALCMAGAFGGRLYLSHSDSGGSGAAGEAKGRQHRPPSKTQIAGNDNFFGEEDRSDK